MRGAAREVLLEGGQRAGVLAAREPGAGAEQMAVGPVRVALQRGRGLPLCRVLVAVEEGEVGPPALVNSADATIGFVMR